MQKLFLVIFEISLLEISFKDEFFNSGLVLGFINLEIKLPLSFYQLLYHFKIEIFLRRLRFLLLFPVYLCNEFYLFQQNLTLFQRLRYLPLLFLLQILLLFCVLTFLKRFYAGKCLATRSDKLRPVERRHALLRSKGFLGFSLHFLKTALRKFVLMLLEV